MNFEPPKNPNYAATVVALSSFVDLPNCDNVKGALIFGNHVIVGKDTKAGDIGLFFPAETQLMRDFVANNNLYRKPEWGNVDSEKRGFFEEHGRVKTMKFRGHKSEGFWIPINSLAYLDVPLNEFTVGATFDCVGDRVICKKYIPRHNSRVGNGAPRNFMQSLKLREEKIVEGQFRFHPDTSQLRKNIYNFTPDLYISISDKWHGTSAVFANILTKRPLKWYERLLKKIGIQIQDQEYGLTWSSRKVIKGVNESLDKPGFYADDIWSVVASEVKDRIPKGYTVYGEIVGFLPSGAAIQSLAGKPYAYGCQPGTHRLVVYRVTVTNSDGRVLELSWNQMRDFCQKYGFEMVHELWYGRAGEYSDPIGYADIEEWQEAMLAKLEFQYVNDQDCQFNPGLPAEGIVVRVDRLEEAEAYKLKNFRFLEGETKELDKGTVDLETAESEEAVVEEPAA